MQVSTTFDPLMFLSVPLPDKEMKLVKITVVWSDVNKTPTQYGVSVPKQSGSMKQVLQSLEKLSGVKADRFIVADVVRGYIHRFLTEEDGVANIYEYDDIRAYECTPSATPEDDLVIFVYNRYKKAYTYNYSGASAFYYLEGIPHAIRVSKSKLTYDILFQTALASFRLECDILK